MGNSTTSELPDNTVDELCSKTNYSAGDIRRMYDDFKTDFPEGVITRDRFIIMYRKMFPEGDATAFAGYVFNAYDQDGNGVIDFNEFIMTIAVAAKGTPEDKLRWAFRLYDLDGDGEVTLDEATEMIMAIHRMQGSENPRSAAENCVARIFHALDKNRDDSLTESEFVAALDRSPAIRELFTAGM